jgi:predicted nucleic acid-binding protein
MGIRVIDTDVWSYLYKGRSEAKLYEPHLFGNILVISFQTQAELLRCALHKKSFKHASTRLRRRM